MADVQPGAGASAGAGGRCLRGRLRAAALAALSGGAALAGAVLAGAALDAVGSPAAAQVVREVKLGVLYHDVPELWSGFQLEPKSVDINFEFLLTPYVRFLGGEIRPAIGASINTRGGTSKAYIDARWEIEGPAGLFLALGAGAAVHNGEIDANDPFRKALGSRVLFHFPAEIGWRWDGHNSLSIYFEHISNGYTQDYNEGLDSIGLRYGYRF